MRILHCVPYYPPERLGGVGEFAARLHGALLEAGHDSFVVTRGVRSEDRVRRIARSAPGWFARSAVWARRASSYDVVHVHAGEALPLLVALRLQSQRPRLLATFHVSYVGVAESLAPYTLEGERFGGGLGPLWERSVVALGHRFVDAAALRIVDAAAPISEACARELRAANFRGRVEVIRHGLPEISDGAQAAVDPVELLYVGAPGHRKRVHALPFVLERVRAVHPQARLRIIGFPWERAGELHRAFAARDLLRAVDCVGFVPSESLPRYYRAAEVLLVPSAYEGLPLVLIEAMQCGLAAVATRVSGNPEAIDDGVTGHLVDLDDTAALAARCSELLGDPARRRVMGEAARRRAHEIFAMERHLAAYLALYAELCDSA